jgi:hypothetical protein
METYRSFITDAPDRYSVPAEKHLAIAVMMTAVDDLVKNRDRIGGDATRNYRDAQRWVLANDESWPYSFVNLCAVLNIPVADLRARLLGSPESFRGLLGELAA